MAVEKTIKFRLPEAADVEVHLVRLADGRLVARTRDELVELPPELRVSLAAEAGEQEESG